MRQVSVLDGDAEWVRAAPCCASNCVVYGRGVGSQNSRPPERRTPTSVRTFLIRQGNGVASGAHRGKIPARALFPDRLNFVRFPLGHVVEGFVARPTRPKPCAALHQDRSKGLPRLRYLRSAVAASEADAPAQ